MNKILPYVTVIVVVYGNRFQMVKTTCESVLKDPHVKHIIIGDNACHDQEGLKHFAKSHPEIQVISMGKNAGYGPAAHDAMMEARKTSSEYLLILDDDSVPEEGGIDMYLSNYKYFSHNKIIFAGNRVDVPGTEKAFIRGIPHSTFPRGTIFEVFSITKFKNFIRLILKQKKDSSWPFLPFVPTTAFVTGGTFLPMSAVREVDPLDNTFFVYGEDLDYAWRLRKAGYEIYQVSRPIIRELDMTFPGNDDAHIWGLWDKSTPDFKVYFRLRNSVIISRRHSLQSVALLLLNIIIWTLGLHLIGIVKLTSLDTFIFRSKLIIRAMRDGYKYPKQNIPDYISIPK